MLALLPGCSSPDSTDSASAPAPEAGLVKFGNTDAEHLVDPVEMPFEIAVSCP